MHAHELVAKPKLVAEKTAERAREREPLLPGLRERRGPAEQPHFQLGDWTGALLHLNDRRRRQKRDDDHSEGPSISGEQTHVQNLK